SNHYYWGRRTTNRGATKGQGNSVSANRPKVFLSYSHKDRLWADRLLTYLRAIAVDVSVWSDAQIKPGANWHDEIARAIRTSDFAILLASDNYFASDFIRSGELPALLKTASQGRPSILWVPISPVHLGPNKPIPQSVINSIRPLRSLKPTEVDKVFAEVAHVIQQRLPKLARPQKGEKPPAD